MSRRRNRRNRRNREDSVVLYHIGPRPPQPRPCRHVEGTWRRQGREDVLSGVFLTPDPVAVSAAHGVRGTVYAVRVPRAVLARAGGLRRYDRATEVIVAAEDWPQCRVLGRSHDAAELTAARRAYAARRELASGARGDRWERDRLQAAVDAALRVYDPADRRARVAAARAALAAFNARQRA